MFRGAVFFRTRCRYSTDQKTVEELVNAETKNTDDEVTGVVGKVEVR